MRWLPLALLLLAAAHAPAPPATSPTAEPRPLATTSVVLAMQHLVYDGDPAMLLSPRQVLSRWAEPMRLFLFAPPTELPAAAQAAGTISRATKLPIAVGNAIGVGAALPNAFLVETPDPDAAFRGSFRPMLANAFGGDATATNRFIEIVVAVEPCWVLPVWTDPSRLVLKAAVIGIDSRLPPVERQRCMLRELGAALGLLGPDAGLANSIFSAQTRATRLSRDDYVMLRLLYGPSLRTGMTPDQLAAGVTAALRSRAPRPATLP